MYTYISTIDTRQQDTEVETRPSLIVPNCSPRLRAYPRTGKTVTQAGNNIPLPVSNNILLLSVIILLLILLFINSVVQ